MALSKAALNEQAKITATWLNTLSTGMILVGVVAPVAAVMSGMAPWSGAGPELGYAALAFIVIGLVLHIGARYVLGGIRE